MSNSYVVVEDGAITCEHGAEVVLVSSESVLSVGGCKPLHDTDLLGAVVNGCPHRSSYGGQCTSVSAITSAVTEANVGGGGQKFLLRVDGCKTDKGAALLLNDPGQSMHSILKKSGGSGSNIASTSLEEGKHDSEETLAKETYRIYPLRKSDKQVRALRAARDFKVLTVDTLTPSGRHSDKTVVTYTGAYLYVSSEGVTTEYKVVSSGDFYNPAIFQVRFKDTQTCIIRPYIPHYRADGTLKFVYSNVKLTPGELAKLDATAFTIDPAKKAYLSDISAIEKFVRPDEKFLTESCVTAESIREKSNNAVATVVLLGDPIGEVEDLYDAYETSYRAHYAHNKPIIDTIRAKNQYPYAVADMLDYLYVSEDERDMHKRQREALREQYERLCEIVTHDMADAVKLKMNGSYLGGAMELRVAKEYLDEVMFIDKSFFKARATFKLHTTEETCIYSPGRMYRGPLKRLKLGGKEYVKLKESASSVLALLIFSVCFGKKYEKERNSNAQLKEAAEKFYYLLKTAKPLPQLNEESLDEIHNELKHQSHYEDLFTGKDPLLDEFEQLDSILKEIAFDPKEAINKKKRKNNFGFSSLKTGQGKEEFYHDEHLQTPKAIAKKISKVVAKAEFTEVLNAYMGITAFEGDEAEYDYYHYLLNLGYMLIAPRAKLDAETHILSVFNNDHMAIRDLIEHLATQLNLIGEEKAQKLHGEKIKALYLEALFTLIAHAKVEKPNNSFPERKKKGKLQIFFMAPSRQDEGREKNATALLDKFAVEPADQEIDTQKILDQNFDEALQVKTESEKLYATLKNIDGVSSYMGKVDDTLDDFGGDTTKPLEGFKSSSKYQKLLAATKVLSFFMTVGKIAEYAQGKEKVKLHNLIGFSGDVLSVSQVLNGLVDKKIKNIPESLEHVVKVNKLVSPASLKVITRFGLVGVMANAVNEIHEVDAKENKDYLIAVSAKNAIYFALLFSHAWVALGAIMVTELVWAFLSDKIKNSKMELYLYDSLLFNTTEHNDNRWFNNIEHNKSYRASIMIEALKGSGGTYRLEGKDVKASELNGFLSIENIRAFIADNYEAHSDVITLAMTNELSRLKSVLYGFGVERIDEYSSTTMASNGIQININSHNKLKLSKTLYDEAQNVFVTYDKAENGSYRTVYKPLPKANEYDITAHLVSQSDEFSKIIQSQGMMQKTEREKKMWLNAFNQKALTEEILNNVSLVVVSDKVSLKYSLSYDIKFEAANSYAEITDTTSVALSDDDYTNTQ